MTSYARLPELSVAVQSGSPTPETVRWSVKGVTKEAEFEVRPPNANAKLPDEKSSMSNVVAPEGQKLQTPEKRTNRRNGFIVVFMAGG